MREQFLIYGATGFVGQHIIRQAVQQEMRPIIAGRDEIRVKSLADELGLDCRVFTLEESRKMDGALGGVRLVLHCAGPFHYTSRQMVEGCLRTRTHYLDLAGDVPVLQSLLARNEEALAKGVMILPGVGFDVVPTDCLAVYLHSRLPSAHKLIIAYQGVGPASLPPGTAKTAVDLLANGTEIRQDGKLVRLHRGLRKRPFDFGEGEVNAVCLTWGDLVTAFFSTGIPNIEEYSGLSKYYEKQKALGELFAPLFRLKFVRDYYKRILKAGSTPEELASTRTHIVGMVEDSQGKRVMARLHGPEAGVIWTAITALGAVRKVMSGTFATGFQTPAKVFGADFVLECGQAVREDVV